MARRRTRRAYRIYGGDAPELGKAPALTYRYAQKQAMLKGDAPTYFMRKTERKRSALKR